MPMLECGERLGRVLWGVSSMTFLMPVPFVERDAFQGATSPQKSTTLHLKTSNARAGLRESVASRVTKIVTQPLKSCIEKHSVARSVTTADYRRKVIGT